MRGFADPVSTWNRENPTPIQQAGPRKSGRAGQVLAAQSGVRWDLPPETTAFDQARADVATDWLDADTFEALLSPNAL